MKPHTLKIALAAATAAFVSVSVHTADSENKASTKNRTKVRARTTIKNKPVGGRVKARIGTTVTTHSEGSAHGRVGIRASDRVGARVMEKAKLKPELNTKTIKTNIQKNTPINKSTAK